MKRLTQEDVVNRLRAERLARAKHRKEGTEESWAELQACITRTNYALRHYDVVMYDSKGDYAPSAASIRRMAAMNLDARKRSS